MWQRQHIEELRVDTAPAMKRVVCAIDPPIFYGHAEFCAIVVAGLGADGHAYVLHDGSLSAREPDAWARAAVRECSRFGAVPLAEYGQGGDLVQMVMARTADLGTTQYKFRAIGRWHRLEPVANLYGEGRVHHVGRQDALERDMVLFGEQQRGEPCERVDALGLAISSLMLRPSVSNFRLI